jgi:putative ABC transport system permease protein
MLLTWTFIVANTVTMNNSTGYGGLPRDTLIVSSVPKSAAGVEYGLSSGTLSLADLTALSNPSYLPTAVSVAPVTGTVAAVSYSFRNFSTYVIGTTQSYLGVSGDILGSGRFISAQDLATHSHVAVIGASVQAALFGTLNPIGQNIQIGGQVFTVVGTLAKRGFVGPTNLDDRVLVPETTFWGVISPANNQVIDSILIRSRSNSTVGQTAQQAFLVLMQSHSLTNPYQATFSVYTAAQLSSTQVISSSVLKRTLAIGTLVAAALAVWVLSLTLQRRRRYLYRHVRNKADELYMILAATRAGILGSVVGVGAGWLSKPFLAVLSPVFSPVTGLTVDNLVMTFLLGIALSVASLLPLVFAPSPESKPILDSSGLSG